MKIHKLVLIILTMVYILHGCNIPGKEEKKDDFIYKIDQFADIKILRYQVPGFEDLSVNIQTRLVSYTLLSGKCFWNELRLVIC